MGARPLDHSLLAVTGYTDSLSAKPGESVAVHASSIHQTGTMRLVRLSHDGRAFIKDEITAPSTVDLAHRDITLGSFGVVGGVDLPAAPLSLRAWVWPTLLPPEGGPSATLIEIEGLSLRLQPDGTASFAAGDEVVTSRTALRRRRWYEVVGGLDSESRPYVSVRPHPMFGTSPEDRVVGDVAIEWTPRVGTLTFGRELNGKMEDVAIDDVLELDFAKGISTWAVHTKDGNAVGRVVGLPTRAVRGRRWDGSHKDWRYAPGQYAAIHFHADDQGDQGWPVSTTLDLPDGLPSGVYAAELTAGDGIDHLPIVVRSDASKQAPLILVLPTETYLAYALEHVDDDIIEQAHGWTVKCHDLAAEFARANGLHSLYDTHDDGSPVVFGSLRRPLLGIRPDHKTRYRGFEHGLSADLFLIGWLERQGFAFDVATDHDLDAEGADLLRPYRAMVTGGHPEYWTARMLDAVETYLDAGGNLAYLGGNGFCWTTAIARDDPSITELRRGQRSPMPMDGEVGQNHLQLTGAPAGLWNACGRMAAALAGTTWSCTGMVDGSPYMRTPASFDPRVAHLFEGIGSDELIGEHGAFLGAAAGDEVDFANPLLGTPEQALVVATARLPEGYKTFPDGLIGLQGPGGEDIVSRRRSDVTYFQTGAGGAVFSASSMAWNGALSYNGDSNAVSQLTGNLLRSFIREA